MFRSLLVAALAAVALVPLGAAEEPKKDAPKPTVDLFASLDDRALQKEAPAGGVIASQKAWEKLAKAWGIEKPAKVDFDKEFLYVATNVGSRLSINAGKLDDKGNLTVSAIGTRDLRDGFRYAIKSFGREGVKTVNGKELPKE
jgi:hypothetical protein